MLYKLNDDNLCNILLYNKSINSINNKLHISKHIYKLIINNYNKLCKNYISIIPIRRWNRYVNEFKLLNGIKYKLYCYNVLSKYGYDNLNMNSIYDIKYNISEAEYGSLRFRLMSILSGNICVNLTLKEVELIKKIL